MTEQGTNVDRHFSVLRGADGGPEGFLKIRVVCGSQADVSVSQVLGVFVRELEDEAFNSSGGPLIVDCPTHGKYLGLLEILLTGAESEAGEKQVSMPLLLIPLKEVEHVLPLELGRRCLRILAAK